MGNVWDWVEENIQDPFEEYVVELFRDPKGFVEDIFPTPEMPDIPELPEMPIQEPGVPLTSDLDLPSMGIESSTYYKDVPINTVSEGIPISRGYGVCKIGGNIIRVEETNEKFNMLIGHSIGPIDSYTTIYVNDIPWSELEGNHSYTSYTGTTTQTADSRFITGVSKACTYRGLAYTAFTFVKNREIGGQPRITTVGQLLKCTPIAGGAKAFTRNPAVILWDWYLNVEGKSISDLNQTVFQALETYCDAIPTGGTIARYRFDYNFDSKMTRNDAKKIIWQSFNGRIIRSQGTFKPVWEQINDDVLYNFTMDNIVSGSFSWNKPKKPNMVRIYYLDSTNEHRKSCIELTDDLDIEENGEIPWEENCWFITNGEIARRRCQFKFDKFRYTEWECHVTGFTGSSHLEVYDRVTVTHDLPNPAWSNKSFIIKSKNEDSWGRPTFELESYHLGIYHDKEASEQAHEGELTPYIWNLPDFAITVSGTSGLGMFRDVSSAIAALPSAGGRVIIKEGTYTIPRLTIPNKNIWIDGENKETVKFIAADATPFYIYNPTASFKFSNFAVESGTGVGGVTYSSMFYVEGVSPGFTNTIKLDIDNIAFTLIDGGNTVRALRGDRAILLKYLGGSVRINNCSSTSGLNFLKAIDTKGLRIMNNIIDSPGYHGITINNNRIEGSVIDSNYIIRGRGSWGFNILEKGSIVNSNIIETIKQDRYMLSSYEGILLGYNIKCSNNNVTLINKHYTAVKRYIGIIAGGDSNIITNSGVSIITNMDDSYGINISGDAIGNVVSGNNIYLYNQRHSDNSYGIYLSLADGSVINDNYIQMSNNIRDKGIGLTSGTNRNQGTSNITRNCGSGVSDAGTNNNVTSNDF